VQNNLLKFGLDVAVKVADFFQNTYFQINEALPPKIGKKEAFKNSDIVEISFIILTLF
jgi:hypothetical protein